MENSKGKKTCEFLHAYEIGLLSDDENAVFEAHLIECDRCFEQVKGFQREAALLSDDETVRNLVVDFNRENSRKRSADGTAKASFWSRISWRFRLASASLAAVLVVAVILVNLSVPEPGRIARLDPGASRGPQDSSVSISDNDTLIVLHRVPWERVGNISAVTLKHIESGVTFSIDDEFWGFDKFGVGEIVLFGRSLEPGKYELTVECVDEGEASKSSLYFKIEK